MDSRGYESRKLLRLMCIGQYLGLSKTALQGEYRSSATFPFVASNTGPRRKRHIKPAKRSTNSPRPSGLFRPDS